MPQSVDGDIRLSVGFDGSKIKNGIKSLSDVFKNFTKSTKETFIQAEGAAGKLTAKLDKATEAVARQTIKVDDLQKKYDEIATGDATPKTLKSLELELNRVQKEYDEAISKNEQFMKDLEKTKTFAQLDINSSGSVSPETEVKINTAEAGLDETANKLDELTTKSEELRNKIESIKLDPQNTVEAQKLADKIEVENQKLSRLKQEANTAEKAVKNAGNKGAHAVENLKNKTQEASKSIKKESGSMSSSFEKMGSKISKTLKHIKQLIMAAFVFNIIRSGLTSLKNYISDILKVNDQFSKSLSKIKGNLKTAFQPIYEAMLPAINALMSGIATATKYIAAFTSALFGKSLSDSAKAAEALNEQAEALKNTGNAAKSASKNMASFDKINKLSDGDSNNSSEIASIYPTDTAEAGNKISTFADLIKSKISEVVDALAPIKDFAAQGLQDFYTNVLKPIGSWVFSENTGLSKFFNVLKEGIKNIDWENINKSLRKVWDAITPFAITVGEGLLWFWENVLVPMGAWVMNKAVPAFLKAIAAVIPALEKTIKKVGNGFKYLWEKGLKPLLGWVGDAVLHFFDWISKNGELVAGLIVGIASAVLMFKTASAIASGISKIKTAFSGIMTLLKGGGLVVLIVGIVTALINLTDLSPGLTAALGAVTIAVAALGIAIGIATGGVTLIISGIVALITAVAGFATAMSKDSIPAIERFSDAISTATQESVGQFMDLYDETTIILNEMMWSGTEITAEMAGQVAANFATMREQAISSLTAQREEAIAELGYLFSEEAAMHEQRLSMIAEEGVALEEKINEALILYGEESIEYAAAVEELNYFNDVRVSELLSAATEEEQIYLDRLAAINGSFDAQQLKIEETDEEIRQILKSAAIDNRELTQDENDRILELNSQFQGNVIKALTDNELEQQVILERIKLNAKNLSAQQAAEVVRNSLKQKEGVVSEAEDQYNLALAEAIKLRKEGTAEANAEADAIIAAATRKRDETIAKAEEMHQAVIDEAKAQSGEYIKQIDWETGEVRSKWSVMWDDIKSGVSNAWSSIKNILGKIGSWFYDHIIKPITDDFKAFINGILSSVEGFVNFFIKGINFLINGINKISFDVPEWVPFIGGMKFGFNIGNVKEISLPRLAQGAVIPPNNEFMAILGDQKHGTNIEAPLETIKQGVREVLSEGGETSKNVTVIFELSGREIGRMAFELGEQEKQRRGVRLVTT